MDIQIERIGQFKVKFWGKNTNQCGPDGETTLNYRVEITGDDSCLDKKGFIIDNNEIHEYFVHKYTVVGLNDFESCERIAMEACSAFRGVLGYRKGLKRICVVISGSKQAALRATWEKTRKAKQVV